MTMLSVSQLVGLLKDKSPVVRQIALENLLPYTQSGNPHIDVWKTNNWEGGRILKILTRDRNVCPFHIACDLTIDCKDITTSDSSINKLILSRRIVENIINRRTLSGVFTFHYHGQSTSTCRFSLYVIIEFGKES